MHKKEKTFTPVMLTPFKDNGSIDYHGLTELTEFYLQAGAGGLFANCQSSEMFELTDEERIGITSHVVKVANRRVPVVAVGTFGGQVTKQADFAKRLYNTGIDSVIIVTSMLAGELESDEVFDVRCHDLLQQTGNIPFGFYECPAPYKRLLSPAQLKTFVDTGRISYHKDTCLDINTVKEKLKVTEQAAGFGLYDAYIVHAIESLKAGSAGLSCIQGNFFPELVTFICKNYDEPSKREELNIIHNFLITNMDVMHGVYPNIAKYFLQQRGLKIDTYCRTFSGVFDAGVKQKVDKLYRDYQQIHEVVEADLTT
ncbi:dihydrodipicolinate synthase family protein [Flavitalea sp.]|nr:dihydrodipicolinate synthase family protein [Flavitalea sp.]